MTETGSSWWGGALDWIGSNVGWDELLAGGIAIAKGVAADEDKKQTHENAKDLQADRLADNERDREKDREIAKLKSEADLAIARLNAATSAENTKKKILGDALLEKGKDQGDAMLESYKSSANKPERFNTAANSLAQLLARR